jgi:L-aspartate oxidase
VTRAFPFDLIAAPLPLSGEPIRSATTDVVVVGAGVAGLAFALSVSPDVRVVLLTKGLLGESNTRWAQGGLSAAIGSDDSIDLHEEDTLFAGAGLNDAEAVRELVSDGPAAVDWLLELGTRFDRNEATGQLELGREAAHSRRRVLHAGGDATGAEIERALVAAVRTRENVEILESSVAIDLVVERGSCAGTLVQLSDGEIVRVDAGAVVLAAGGAGQLWATTSNPPAATGDGIAIALRAGAAVADLEFCQFHPTVLQLPGEVPFLVSEAVRGEGAYLRNRAGERFMLTVHDLAELAPRDVVARGIQAQMIADGTDHAWLDLRHLDATAMRKRFPTIARELDARGIDLTSDLIPVAPAAHYFMGGIVADEAGRTTLPGLLAIGEAACTGVHGANRLASNSLLEGLVFGRRAATTVAPSRDRLNRPAPVSTRSGSPAWQPSAQPGSARATMQALMSRYVSVVRDREGLETAIGQLTAVDIQAQTMQEQWLAANTRLASLAIAHAALLREESRGAHFRSDFPERDPALDGVHLVLDRATGAFQRATLDETLPVPVS